MNKYEKIYLKAQEKSGRASWIDSAIASLAIDIEESTGEPVEIRGPFGLRAEVYITVGEKDSEGRRFLLLTPEFPDCGFKLYYDTGETVERYGAETLGDFNGLNNVSAPLPDTLEEIIQILRPY